MRRGLLLTESWCLAPPAVTSCRDLSLEEIAQTLGIGLSATKMRVHRAQHHPLAA